MNKDLRQMVRELLLLRTAFNDGVVLNLCNLLPHSLLRIYGRLSRTRKKQESGMHLFSAISSMFNLPNCSFKLYVTKQSVV
jgi:hypothetical protein